MEDDQSPAERPLPPEPRIDSGREWSLPFAITLAALLIYFGFQTIQLMAQRNELSTVKSSQEAPLQAAQKVQDQFKTMMTKLNELANQGHVGAKMLLDELQNTGGGPGTKAGQ